jgi:hypothetical protein
VDGVQDVVIGWRGSARPDEFPVVSPGRVAA